MKAVIYNEYGGPDVLQVAEVAKLKPADNEVLVRVSAAEVTKGDCELRSFKFPVKWFSFGLRLVFGVFRPRKKILGGYFSGTIEEIGAKVSKFKLGDEVFGASRLKLGAYAQYLVLPENYTIVHKPSNLSFEQAAEAHRCVEAEQRLGIVVLKID
jgi:NADPH:quinone reductase-like Zn-dependent oxidoreductase